MRNLRVLGRATDKREIIEVSKDVLKRKYIGKYEGH